MWLPPLVSTNHALLLSPLHHSWRFSIPHSCRHDAFHSSPSLREGSLLHAASSERLIDLFNILSSSSHHPMSMSRSPLFDLLPPSPPFRITPVSRSLYLLIDLRQRYHLYRFQSVAAGCSPTVPKSCATTALQQECPEESKTNHWYHLLKLNRNNAFWPIVQV